MLMSKGLTAASGAAKRPPTRRRPWFMISAYAVSPVTNTRQRLLLFQPHQRDGSHYLDTTAKADPHYHG